MPDHSKDTGFWSWIGKIASLLGAIYLVFQIYDVLRIEDYEITTEGEFASFTIPSTMADALDKAGESAQIKKYDSLWRYTIKNTGRKEIKDLKLELPFKGDYKMSRPGEGWVSSSFEKIIPIPSLRPSHEAVILVWTGGRLDFFNAEESKVTYPDGVARISYSIKVAGLGAWLYLNKIYGTLILLVIVLFIINLYRILKSNIKTRLGTLGRATKEDTESAPFVDAQSKQTPDRSSIDSGGTS